MDQQAPPFFKQGPTPLTRLIFFASLSLILMVSDARFNTLTGLRQSLSVIIAPLQRMAMTPAQLLRKTSSYFVIQEQLQKANTALEQKQLLQAAQLQRNQATQAENAYLRRVLGIQQQRGENVIVTEIIYAGRDPFSQKITVNKGSNHLVQAGQPALDDVGVIGQVTRVYPFSSEITLLTDKDQAIPVEVVRSGARVVAFGHGQDNTLELPFMAANADIQNGDVLVTSGIDGIYPAGLPVAVVTKIERSAVFAKITCTPSAGVNRHKQLLILVGDVRHPEQTDPETTTTVKDQPSTPKKGRGP